MSIRPVDMQAVMPKSLEFSRQQQSEINKQDLDERTFMHASNKEADQKQKMVRQSNEAEENINKDGHNKQEYEGKNKKKNQNGKDEEDDKNKSVGLFDMRI